MFAPWVTGLLGIFLVGKGIKGLAMSPNARIGVGKLIKTVDKAILTSENPSMIKQLRADRALLIELMKDAETSEEE